MKKAIYIIAILSMCSFTEFFAQSKMSLGVGGGPNMYFGSVANNEKTGFTAQLDARYNFNNILSTTLSYSFNNLQGCKLNSDGTTNMYFETKANNIDIHIGIDVFQYLPSAKENSPLKVIIDAGAGLSIYDEGLYNDNDELINNYMAGGHGWGTSVKANLGGEIDYSINKKISIFGSLLFHYYFTSELDGYAHYSNEPTKPTKNDTHYTTSVGIRYNLNRENKTSKKAPVQSFGKSSKPARSVDKKSTKKTLEDMQVKKFEKNQRKSSKIKRKQAKKALKKEKAEAAKKNQRYSNRKENGGIE